MIEALLFLSLQPVSVADLSEATEATEGQVGEAIELCARPVEGVAGSSCARWRGASPWPATRPARPRARRAAGEARTPPATRRRPRRWRSWPTCSGSRPGGGADPRASPRSRGPDPGRAWPDRGARDAPGSGRRSSEPPSRRAAGRPLPVSTKAVDRNVDPTPEDGASSRAAPQGWGAAQRVTLERGTEPWPARLRLNSDTVPLGVGTDSAVPRKGSAGLDQGSPRTPDRRG